ncbi:response regulator transcription factor [Nocardioides sp. SR21]|uniref:response regulator transcription factor n=1 Tax=Nocardioides sp. SR21 TaxID=2919501 RepID=UPI001FAB0312|nr:response regulator transcription factor [Nocardioides sp. SR21]
MTQPLARGNVRVLIIEDHALFAESLELALSLEGYNVRRCAPPSSGVSPGAMLSAAVRAKPRIALLDLDLGQYGDGTRMITPLVTAGVQVVVVTASSDRPRWGECLRLGARKVLAKTEPLNEILATVRRINQGFPVIDREERDRLVQLWHDQHQARRLMFDRLSLLTPRECEVLGQLMRGYTVREIASMSVVSEATVRTQVKSVLAKLEVSSQLAAVGMAHNLGWQPPLSTAS